MAKYLIQCVLAVFGYYFQKTIFFLLVFVIGLFSEKRIFVSCDCDWKLFSEKKKIFVSCVCNWILFSEKKRFLILVIVIGYYFQKKDFCFLCL